MSDINPDASKHIDEYINSIPDFSRKICTKLRKLIHKADKRIIEDWKWGPNFNYKGMACGFAGFKTHAHIIFFNGAAMKDSKKLFNASTTAVKMRGIKFTDVSQINDNDIIDYVRESINVNERGIANKALKEIKPPQVLSKLLSINKTAKEFFDSLSYTNRKEYISWITDAKKEETRKNRLGKVIGMLKSKIKHP